ncbi:DUF1828 domain-containing protein [Rickettsia endosymbiont of Pantilius tunicatus]|uniref:DUF1828 domain-containing protein n=1 Tax=Rickettsia endosymbiont of Pantilius tunicatus TaxID=3066267 RepID=UPI0030DE16BA
MSDVLEKAIILFKYAKKVEEIERNTVCLTTQYLDQRNDYLQIYLIAEEQGYTLTDDGWILDDIKHLANYDENQELIAQILQKLDIRRNEDEIYVKIDLANLTKAKDNFIRAICAINEILRNSIQTCEVSEQ